MRTLRLIGVIYVCCLIMTDPGALAAKEQTVAHNEYEIKAAFIFNFMQFISWPENTLSDSGTINIKIVGDFHHCHQLKALEGKKFGNHKIAVSMWTSGVSPDETQILFVVAGAEDKLQQIRMELKGHPPLIISDSDKALGKGAMIAFYIDGSRIRFKIDNQEALRHKFKISSRLLRLATIVNSDKKEPAAK